MPKEKDISIIYGRHPVVDALRSGTPIEKVMLQQGIRGEMEKELRHLCRDENVLLQVVPKERLNKIVRGNHQGVIALQALIRYYRLEDVLPGIYERSETPLIVLLDGVTDVRNFGAIARTAEAAGAQALVIPQKNSAQINAEAMKTSAGALAAIPVCRESSLIAAIEYLQLSGIKVLASDLAASKPLYALDLRQPVAFILGAEGEGISPAVARAADDQFIIPQKGTTDSFNVSVAAGMMLYEAMRQRREE
ncbi:MAG: 23S rRNA (guanosine(2251)-2'-O)-methyltransferase RlmB [Phaeodactylibacter sp.]|nr:23S rRNA (guanosine(2251)-2'-O)-methyltransferase RlmB [Phaeodactylibacter sp.]